MKNVLLGISYFIGSAVLLTALLYGLWLLSPALFLAFLFGLALASIAGSLLFTVSRL